MEQEQYLYKDEDNLKKFQIRGIDKNGKRFLMHIYAEDITKATCIQVCDYIKEVTSVEKLEH